MSRQINLFHPRYLTKREWLTLANVAIACAVVTGGMALVGTLEWREAAVRGAEAAAAEATLNEVRAQVETQTQLLATRTPNAQLAAEVAQAEESLARRGQIARLLESGTIGNSAGFSDYLRGFARQTLPNLWLTGFSIGSGGEDMEIRGRMLNGGALPEYLRRLGSEKAFEGRTFAALTLNRPAAVVVPTASPPAAAAAVAPPAAPADYVEFVLIPQRDTPVAKP